MKAALETARQWISRQLKWLLLFLAFYYGSAFGALFILMLWDAGAPFLEIAHDATRLAGAITAGIAAQLWQKRGR